MVVNGLGMVGCRWYVGYSHLDFDGIWCFYLGVIEDVVGPCNVVVVV